VDEQNQFDEQVTPAEPAPEAKQPEADSGEQSWNMVPISAVDHAKPVQRRRILVAIALVLAVGLAVWIYKRNVDPIHALEAFDAGERLMKRARYSQAMVAFDQAIGLDSNFAEAYSMRGRANMALAKPVAAIPDFTKVIEIRPNDPQGYLDRGSAHVTVRDWPEALVDFNKAIELDSKLALAYNLRGSAVRAMGDPRKALADFNRAVELLPNMDNHFQRGATHQKVGEHEAAIADFSRVISFEPSSAQAYFARSLSYRAIGDVAAANRDHRTGRILDGK
jgi:tetratricopeptide (TPR) repeat protein